MTDIDPSGPETEAAVYTPDIQEPVSARNIQQPEGAPDLPERFSTGGGTAEERDAWIAEHWGKVRETFVAGDPVEGSSSDEGGPDDVHEPDPEPVGDPPPVDDDGQGDPDEG